MDFTQILSSFGGGAFTMVAFIVALSVIVAIHEYGHYIVGRWTGIHAEVFSLGFGPVLYQRTDKRGTVWQIAALPFGGYVKFWVMPMPLVWEKRARSVPLMCAVLWRVRRFGRGP